MKCINCETEWNAKEEIAKSIIKCPFCGENPLEKKPEPKFYETTKEALAAIYKQFGADVLLGKLNAYLPDLEPSVSSNDKGLVYMVYEKGAAKVLKNNLNASKEDMESAVKIAVRNLTEAYINQDTAEKIVYEFTDAIGWKIEKAAPAPSEAEKKIAEAEKKAAEAEKKAAEEEARRASVKPVQTGSVSPAVKPTPSSSSGTNHAVINVAVHDSKRDMKVEFIYPFTNSFFEILTDLTTFKVKKGKMYLQSVKNPVSGFSAWIGISGDIEGRLIITMDRNIAVNALNVLSIEVTDEVIESMYKDYANMIVVHAKDKLNEIGYLFKYTDPVFYSGIYTEKGVNLLDDALVETFELSA